MPWKKNGCGRKKGQTKKTGLRRKNTFGDPFFSVCGLLCGQSVDHLSLLSQNATKCKEKPPFLYEKAVFWSCWADSNRRPHPYQKPLLIVDKYPFMLGYFPESLVVQGVRGFPFSSCVIRVCLVLGRFIPSAGRFVGSCLGFIALDNSQTHSHRWNLRLPLRCDRCT